MNEYRQDVQGAGWGKKWTPKRLSTVAVDVSFFWTWDGAPVCWWLFIQGSRLWYTMGSVTIRITGTHLPCSVYELSVTEMRPRANTLRAEPRPSPKEHWLPSVCMGTQQSPVSPLKSHRRGDQDLKRGLQRAVRALLQLQLLLDQQEKMQAHMAVTTWTL